MTDVWSKLAEPFPAHEIDWRPGTFTKDKKKAMALAYIDARAAMRRLDEVVGPGNWQDEYRLIPFRRTVTDKKTGERYIEEGVTTICRLGLKVDDSWIWREDGSDETDIEAAKGGISGAFKRAVVKYGMARYLYDLPNQWVEVNQYKRFERTPTLPSWALPGGSGSPWKKGGRTPDTVEQFEEKIDKVIERNNKPGQKKSKGAKRLAEFTEKLKGGNSSKEDTSGDTLDPVVEPDGPAPRAWFMLPEIEPANPPGRYYLPQTAAWVDAHPWDEWKAQPCWRKKGERHGLWKYEPFQVVLGGEGGGRYKMLAAAVEWAVLQVEETADFAVSEAMLKADYCLRVMERRDEYLKNLDPLPGEKVASADPES